MTNMVSSLDGGATVDGVSKGLGGPGDRAVFVALRAQADAVLVGAGTARTEQYRMPRTPPETLARQRSDRGQHPAPALVVISASLDFDDALPFLGESASGAEPPIILTVRSAPADRRRALSGRCAVIDAGDDAVEPRAALDALWALGHRVVLCEGGPRLLGTMIADGVVDEWNQTIAPLLVGGEAPRIITGPAPAGRPFTLVRLLRDESHLFASYRRADTRVTNDS